MLRAFQWDLARQVERLDHLLGLLPRYAEWGYERLYLHLEDAVDYPSLPGVARADAYSWREFETLVAAASAHGIGVVPIANLLGHTQYLIKTPAWRDLNELRDPATGVALPAGQICPLHPRTPELVEKLFGDLAPLCTAGEIHAGLDESFHLGRHPLSRAEIASVGLAAHFAGHVTRLHAAASGRGLRLGLWADMLALLPEAVPLLAPLAAKGSAPGAPAAALSAYDWYYHPFARHPRMELYNFSEYDLPPALAAAGIEHWACPMNGAFRHEVAPVWTDRLQNLAAWHRRALATRAAGYLVTSWEPHRLALPTTTLLSAAAANLWLNPSAPDDPATLLSAGLRRLASTTRAKCNQIGYARPGAVAVSAAAGEGDPSAAAAGRLAGRLARRLLAGDDHAFAGNSRWEINSRWDLVGPRRESPAPHARAARAFNRLGHDPFLGRTSPYGFLGATARFQAYLAARDAFVRLAAGHVHRLRRQVSVHPAALLDTAAFAAACVAFAARLPAARAAARALWTASRPASTFAVSPNAVILRADAARLRVLRAWLRAVVRRPARVFHAAPVCGRWTLRFTLHHFAPCHQKVVVEQLLADPGAPDGPAIWRELHSRVLIEFRAAAARPLTPRLRFEFAVPVDDPVAALRIAARCRGEFEVSHIELTDGVVTRPFRPSRTRHRLGFPAPGAGWPVLDWKTNTGTLALRFSEPGVA